MTRFCRAMQVEGKTESICHFAFSLVIYRILASQDTQIPGKTARKVSLSHPSLCAPGASKNSDLRAAVSPNAVLPITSFQAKNGLG